MTSPYGPPPARSPWSAPIVLASIAIGSVLLAASIVVGLMVIKPSNDHNTGTPTTTTVTQTTTDSSESTDPTTTSTTITTTTTRPPGGAGFKQPSVANTDPHGFTDGGPRCQVQADPVMMVVVTDRSQAIICQSAATGREYYVGKSDVSDGAPVTVQTAGRQDAGWAATAPDGTQYLMSPSGFVVITKEGQSYPDTVQDYWSQ